MGKVRSALDIALEKAGKIGTLSEEEKNRIKDEEKIRGILADFYQARITPDELWKSIKNSNPSLIKTAQMNLVDSLGLGSAEIELQMRKQGILAVEILKEQPNTSVIEMCLNAIEGLHKEYERMKVMAIEDLRKNIEQNPQLRMVTMKTRDGRSVQLPVSVDDAVKAKAADFLSEYEERYADEFQALVEELKKAVQ
jgi:hypothetical protein